MGRSEDPNMGLPTIGRQYLVNYSFWVTYYRWLEGKMGPRKDESSY
jgi:hypothetical protein